MQLPGHFVANMTVAVEDKRRGHAAYRTERVAHRSICRRGDEGIASLFCPGRDFFWAVVDADGDHLKAARTVVLPEFVYGGIFFAAVGAPGRPKVDQDDASLQRLTGNKTAIR